MAKRKQPKAVASAQSAYDKAVKAEKKVKTAYNNARKKVDDYSAKAKKAKTKADKTKYQNLSDKWSKTAKSKKSALRKASKRTAKAKRKLNKVTKTNKTTVLNKIADKIKDHNDDHNNEGHASIYRSDGSSSQVIYIAPTETESEDTQTNITSWPVDTGAPRSNYARVTGKTIQVSGIITGKTRAEAREKFNTLRTWNSRHYELTFKGNIYYKHLIISSLQRSYSNFRDNIAVSITFQFVYSAEITSSSTKKTAKKKTSKASKTTRGNRTKKYTAITIKAGDTLYGLSKKYGKSVSWLKKVNKIKGTTIIAGKKMRVK